MEQAVAEPTRAAATGVALAAVVRILGGKPVLDGVDLTIAEHERLGVVGRSGAGKSTLLSLVAGLDEPDRGVVSVRGETASARRLERCALMPQRDSLLPWRTALDNACLALENAGMRRAEAREEARPLFVRFGLDGCGGAAPGAPVGRDAPARGLPAHAARRARTSSCWTSLSARSTRSRARELQEWLAAALAEAPQTVVLVTHDIEEALLLCDRVAVLSRGRSLPVLEVDVERDVADPAFVELRKRALEALE